MSAFNHRRASLLLNTWIDFNGNGSLTDAGEQIANNVQMIGGAAPNAVNFTIPSVVTAAATGTHYRCSTQSSLAPTGSASNGEVEDYMVTITQQEPGLRRRAGRFGWHGRGQLQHNHPGQRAKPRNRGEPASLGR